MKVLSVKKLKPSVETEKITKLAENRVNVYGMLIDWLLLLFGEAKLGPRGPFFH